MLLSDYASTCNTELFDGQVIIAEDMKEAYLNLRNDLVEKGKRNIDDIDEFHGLAVQPANVDGFFTILLNEKSIQESILNDNINWFGTLIHEAVHVDDFKLYFKLVESDSYDELYEYNLHRSFLYWTEFHARAIGHYFLRKYTLENFKDIIHLDNLIYKELPFQIDYMVTQIKKTDNPDRKAYVVVHFLGRLAIWQYLYPDVFNAEFISELLNSNPWMEDLYYFLIKYKSLKEIYPHINEIETIINPLFSED